MSLQSGIPPVPLTSLSSTAQLPVLPALSYVEGSGVEGLYSPRRNLPIPRNDNVDLKLKQFSMDNSAGSLYKRTWASDINSRA